MKNRDDETGEPRWLELAAALRADPAPDTLARVRARLAARATGPTWVRWLARPITLAVSAALLVVSAFAGTALLTAGAAGADESSSVVSAVLGDDDSYGLSVDRDAAGPASPDSEDVSL